MSHRKGQFHQTLVIYRQIFELFHNFLLTGLQVAGNEFCRISGPSRLLLGIDHVCVDREQTVLYLCKSLVLRDDRELKRVDTGEAKIGQLYKKVCGQCGGQLTQILATTKGIP